jgi:hypothetical protein
LALRDVGSESESGSVRFHERRVTSVGQGVNTVAGRLADARINLAFCRGAAGGREVDV